MNSLEAAMRVLKLVDQGRPVLRVGEVSRALGLQKSTVSRLLRAMCEHELIERERDGQGYVAGRRALVLANLYLSAHSLLDLVDTAVDALVEEFEFVGYAGALSGPDIVILRLKHGRYPLRLVQEVGVRVPAWRTAIGQALLARKPDAEAFSLIKAQESESDPGAVHARLDAIRQTGVISLVSAIVPGIAAMGAAVADPGRNEALGFALSYPVSATDEEMRELMARRVREEAQRIGTRLGDPFWVGLDAKAEVIEIRDRRHAARRRSSQPLEAIR
ncbi:MAG: IclR family transcriptional regulator [Hyphomicrobiales bacterium]